MSLEVVPNTQTNSSKLNSELNWPLSPMESILYSAVSFYVTFTPDLGVVTTSGVGSGRQAGFGARRVELWWSYSNMMKIITTLAYDLPNLNLRNPRMTTGMWASMTPAQSDRRLAIARAKRRQLLGGRLF